MKNIYNIILNSYLFNGISEKEAKPMLNCLDARIVSYTKNQYILRLGDEAHYVGMILSGSARIIKEDYWGNCNILSKITPGELFAEVYACKPGALLGVSVIAEEDTDALFLDIKRIVTTCPAACDSHTRIIRNLISVLADKNLMMNEKLTHMAQRTTREKLLSYLSAQSYRLGTSTFEIPFNRQQLADYLSVDRSAMSNELSKMKNEGIIDFSRNRFTLKITG